MESMEIKQYNLVSSPNNIMIIVYECDIGMGLEWSGNETHQMVRVVKVEKLVHEVKDARP